MKQAADQLKRWLIFFVFAVWSGFLLFLLTGRYYVVFLRPEFGVLLAIAYFISSGYMITAIFRSGAASMNMSAVTRALVLLIPVLYGFASQDTILEGQAFMQRYTGVTGLNFNSDFNNAEADNYPYQINPGNLKNGENEDETILSIYLDPEKYRGRHVKITGMFQRDKELREYFGGIETVVYRFVINCCAADALPLAIAFDSNQAAIYENDQWVQIEGIFDIKQIDDQKVPLIIEPILKPVDKPTFPYLF